MLADIPFTLEWHVPAEKVVTNWRVLAPADGLEDVSWQAAGPLIDDGEPSAVLLAGMMVCAADGMLVNLPDTPENLAMVGSTGTADDSSPFPQLRIVAVTARAGRPIFLADDTGRAKLGGIPGSSSAGDRASGLVLRSGSPRLVIQEARAWLTATQLVRASAAAALRSEAAAARALRRKDTPRSPRTRNSSPPPGATRSVP